VIFKSFHSPEVTDSKREIAIFLFFSFSLYSQKYREGWNIFLLYFWFILSHNWLNLPRVYRHFFYIFLWMIAILATNKKKSLKKRSTATTLFVLLMSAVDESGAAWWWWQNIETCIGRRAVGCGVWPGDKTRPTRLNPIQLFLTYRR
jgi:hypothetical protein